MSLPVVIERKWVSVAEKMARAMRQQSTVMRKAWLVWASCRENNLFLAITVPDVTWSQYVNDHKFGSSITQQSIPLSYLGLPEDFLETLGLSPEECVLLGKITVILLPTIDTTERIGGYAIDTLRSLRVIPSAEGSETTITHLLTPPKR